MKRLKGADRPLQNERARAEVLAALEAVDLVVVFEEDTPLKLIERIKPSVLVKGGDYTREQVVGHDVVEAAGGEVMLVPTCRASARRRWSIAARAAVASAAVIARPSFEVWRKGPAALRLADIGAMLVAMTLPWSTSASAIFTMFWIVAALLPPTAPAVVRRGVIPHRGRRSFCSRLAYSAPCGPTSRGPTALWD